MSGDEEIGALSSEEQAYFTSRGDPEAKPEPAQPNGDQPADPAQPEPDKGPELAGDPEPSQKETVPLATLLEERKASKEFKTRLAEIEKQNAVLQDRWNTILAVKPEDQKPVDDDPEPDPNVDIFAHSVWQSRQLAKLKGEVTETKTQAEQEREYAQREHAIQTVWGNSLTQAKVDHPDLQEAFTHMAEVRTMQLRGLAQFQPQFATQEGINAQIDAELKDLIVAAHNADISPAKYVYSLAPSYGYVSKPKGGTQAPAVSDAVKGLEKAEAAMSAATSLSSASGDRPGSGIDAEAIANMSEAEFKTWIGKPGSMEKWRKAAGG